MGKIKRITCDTFFIVVLPCESELLLLLLHQFCVRSYEIQKARGGDVRFPTGGVIKSRAYVFRANVEEFARHHRVYLHLFVDVYVGGAAQSHLFQSVLRPHVEPVDGATVHQAGIESKPDSETVADGAEAEHDVQLLFASIHEVSQHRQHRYVQVTITTLSG